MINCLGCKKDLSQPYQLRSRCLTQHILKRWTGYCVRCCCLNHIKGKEC